MQGNYNNFEIYLPLSYWATGKPVTPYNDDVSLSKRVNELNKWCELYYSNEFSFNWFSESADTLAMLMTSSKPVFTTATSDRFQQTLQKAIHDMIVHYVIFGTALIRIMPSRINNLAEAKVVYPTHWFPANEIESSLLIWNYDSPYMEVIYDYGNGQVKIERYENGKSVLNSFIDSVQVDLCDETSMAEVDSQTIGRPGFIVNFKRQPDTGDWGKSILPELIPLNNMFNERLDMNNDILNKHQSPRQHAYFHEGAGIEDLPPVSKTESFGDAIGNDVYQDNRIEAKLRQERLVAMRRQEEIFEVPMPIKDIKYVQPSLDFNASKMQKDWLVENICAKTNVPPRFYGLTSNDQPLSGRALLVQYSSPRMYVTSLLEEMIPKIKRCLQLGALIEGVNIEAEVEWENYLEAFMDATMQMTDDDNMLDAGRPDVPVEGEQDVLPT